MGNGFSEPLDFSAPADLRHFEIGRAIGKGAFGKVRIIEHRQSKVAFALKQISKDYIVKQRCYRNVIRERVLLERLQHPFIVNLRYAFQDDDNVFMAFDLMLGGDLRFHLNAIDLFSEPMVSFYAAEICSALIYLHSRNVIHRDIKPDNLLLDKDGHVHVTDFNCACILEDGKGIVSETGTQGYMAPEVYGETGYRESVDWWSLGITLWELLHGERPFAGRTSEELAQLVSFADTPWARECSPELKAFVLHLLEKEAHNRLGCDEFGPLAVKEHPLFRSIEWDKMVARQLPPPFIPATETLNFDARYELEDILLEDMPLVPRARRQKQALSREMQIIEDEFKMFDFSIYERYTGITDPLSASVGEPPSWVKCVDSPRLTSSQVQLTPATEKAAFSLTMPPPAIASDAKQYPSPDSSLDGGDASTTPVSPETVDVRSPGYKLPQKEGLASPPPSPTKQIVSNVTGMLTGHQLRVNVGSTGIALQAPQRTHQSPLLG
ncbi:hypothetical protein RI367_005114 [Sorochytrium milnesiophthora]